MINKFGAFLNENKTNNIGNMIDYTNLKDRLTIDNVKDACESAKDNNYYSVCVRPEYLSTASAFLENSDVKLISVVDFPKGDMKIKNKLTELNQCITAGIDEIDVVMNYKKLKELDTLDDSDESKEKYESIYETIQDDIRSIAKVCHTDGVLLKIIIETGALTYEQIRLACEICVDSGADYIQTSTGFLNNDETNEKKLEKIKYMKNILPGYMKLKVSGGIRTMEDAKKFLPYVDRLGTSSIF